MLALAVPANSTDHLAAQEQEATTEFAVAERWLAAEQPSRKLLEDAVKELLAMPAAGFDWLTKNRALAGEAQQARRKSIETLIVHCTLEYLRQRRETGVVFAGQYELLLRLQPFVGDMLFGLLLDSPEWYPHTHRIHLVRPLRDLYRRSPSETCLAQVAALAESTIEPEDLRRALACMLWQWGHKVLAQQRLEALRQASAEGDAEERVRTLLDLAELQYELLEYRAAAVTHRSVEVLAASSGTPLRPMHFYSSACVHALSGDVEHGLASLQKCAALLASPDLDSSHRLKRSLWETDPEIARLRADPRHAEIFELAFGASPPPAESKRR